MAAISLSEAVTNTQDDYDATILHEARRAPIMDTMTFDDAVSPTPGGGGTLSYSYRRETVGATASTRAINAEYVDQNIETKKITVECSVLGGSYAVDRVLRGLGADASGVVAANTAAKIAATAQEFSNLVINGDTATDPEAFDGLDKILTGTSTEIQAGARGDLVDFDTNARAEHKLLDLVDEWLGELDGTPTAIVANKRTLARFRAAFRRAGMFTLNPVEGLLGQDGRPIEREGYGGIILIDAGNKPGTNAPIIPITAGKSDAYAYRVAPDGFHAVTTMGGDIIKSWLPDHSTSGAVKRGEVEMIGAVALKKTKAATVLRGLKLNA